MRDLVKKNLVILINIPSKKNTADILTKAKLYSVFEDDRNKLLCITKPLLISLVIITFNQIANLSHILCLQNCWFWILSYMIFYYCFLSKDTIS
jgi:hypothetical protein